MTDPLVPRPSLDIPAALTAEVARSLGDAPVAVDRWWQEDARGYAEVTVAARPCFLRWSGARADHAVLAHEVAVRRALAGTSAFRMPEVLAYASWWVVEERVVAEPLRGRTAIAAAVRAAVAIADAVFPKGPYGNTGPGGARRRLARLARVRRSALPLRDVVAARRLFVRSPLPVVPAHGDFHTGNVLFAAGAVWLIDWELAGLRPRGFDLMQLWATLDDADDRVVVFEEARSWLGSRWDRALAELRYVLLVRAIVAKLAPDRPFDRDPVGGRRLLALLPEVRAAAGLTPSA